MSTADVAGHARDRPTAPAGRWWAGFALALFLLVPVDLLTTLLAVARHGVGVEANPLVRWLIQQGVVAVVLANVAAVVLAVVCFHLAVRAVERAPAAYRRPLHRLVSAWVALVCLAGVALTANNLVVVF